MARYLVGRVLQAIAALFLAAIIIFFLARLTGDPLDVMLPEGATPETRALMAEHLGLDKSLAHQYWRFMANAAKGDFGVSIRYRRPVAEFILARFPATVKLAGAAALGSVVIALPLGVLCSLRRDRWQDIIGKSFALVGQAVPSFWLGIVLIRVFSVDLGWLPSGTYGGIQYYILPAFTLGWSSAAGLLRLTRSSMLDILGSDYVRLARIKGVPERLVIWKHALRNALIPLVTFSGVIYVHFLLGSVVTETVFAWPGVGRLAYEAIFYRDFPLIQGLVLVFVGLYLITNMAIDVLYVYLDPRVRYVKG